MFLEIKLGKKIIIDTNFLFVPSMFRLDIFEEMGNIFGQRIEPIILLPTYKELKKLAESESPKMRKNASLGLELAKKCKIVEVDRRNMESNDDLIFRMAVEWKCPVATNDRELRTRLRKAGVAVVFLRQKSRLAVEGGI
ncbi:MAG: PIN domain-containing protein [Candidatus Bathyarchaeia archaeon]|jgi:rRNA-processing protein FCF1|nr:nucleotide-binding protein [Candidatus Bathyarchaeota archaeon]